MLAVKENQPSLLAEIRSSLEAIERLPADDRAVCANEFREVEKVHGRIETRRCVVSDLLSKWRPVALWPSMRSIAMVESTREIGDTVSVERRYYVSSLPPDAARIAHAVRSHWRIENSMHWVLDVAFGEDQSGASRQRGAELRHPASNHYEPVAARYVDQGRHQDSTLEGRHQRPLPHRTPWLVRLFMRLPGGKPPVLRLLTRCYP